MRTGRTSAALACALTITWMMAALVTGARGQSLGPGETMIQGTPPVTFQVAVKVSNLMPEVENIRVHCIVQQSTAAPIMHGYTTTQIPTSGSFDGVVTVPVNILYPNQSVARISQANSYSCVLELVNNGNPPQAWAPDPINAPVWAQPKTGTKLVKSISGTFPPK